ncbi:hypothetical protein EMIHUDRAFT_432595, partial [Emiliania huxleyi CCMP1516]|uniref:Uncharacterized protein n=2 Tax=Emiliania huxleyi TaxID=2903 RepID=A0A0D3ITZ9_EMIH1
MTQEYEALPSSAAPSRTRTASTTRGVLCIILRDVATTVLLLGAFGGATMLLAGKHSVPAPPGIQEELVSCCLMEDGAGRRLAKKRGASSSSAEEDYQPACKRVCSKQYADAAAAAASAPALDSSLPPLLQDLRKWRCPEEYLSGGNDTRIMENPTAQVAFVNRLKATALPGTRLVKHYDEWVKWLDMVAEEYHRSVNCPDGLDPCFQRDFDTCIGVNGGRTVAFGRRTIRKLADPEHIAEEDLGITEQSAACQRVNARFAEMTATTRIAESIADMRRCDEGSVWRSQIGPTKGSQGHACFVCWPVMYKAVHFDMMANSGYTWEDINRRARCLYGLYANLHGFLGKTHVTRQQQKVLVKEDRDEMQRRAAAYMSKAFDNKDLEMAPFGVRFVITETNRPDEPELDVYFPSFKREHVGPKGNALDPKWTGLPKALMQHHANKMIVPGGAASAVWTYRHFLWTTGTASASSTKKQPDGSVLKTLIPRKPPPLHAREYKWMILTGPDRVADAPLCLMQNGCSTISEEIAMANPEQMETIVARDISDESWAIG